MDMDMDMCMCLVAAGGVLQDFVGSKPAGGEIADVRASSRSAMSPVSAPAAVPVASDALLDAVAERRSSHPPATAKEVHVLLNEAGVMVSLSKVKKLCSRLSATKQRSN